MLADPKFWVAASFVIFVALVARTGWKKVTEMLDARTARIASELQEAARLRAEAEATLAAAQREREEATREAAAMLERAQAEAKRLAEAALAEAEAAAGRRERMAMDRIAAAEASAVNEVRLAATELAAAAAQRLLAEGHTADADAPLVDQAIGNLPQALRAA